MRRTSGGMTLIEVLMVVAIVALVYIFASAKVIGMQTEAKIAKAHGDLKTLKYALDSYIQENKVCPRKGDYQRILSYAKPTVIFCDYMDPFGDSMCSMYPYEVSANNEKYVVYSVGPKMDGKATIANDGKVSIKGSPIFETNGFD
jgi:prepilin-type N-terminal cleavage/methylation domain-containing protein